MGATKLLAEKLACAQAAENQLRRELGILRPSICCVRFGNVAASTGSVIPILIRQIYQGGPVTLTHAKMARFMMSIPQAVELVIKAAEKTTGGEIFVLKMKALFIKDLIQVLIEQVAPMFGKDPNEIKIQKIGLRAGEKLDEDLITPEEFMSIVDEGDLYKIIPQHLNRPDYFDRRFQHLGTQGQVKEYTGIEIGEHGISSENVPKMSSEEIKGLLDQIGLLNPDIVKAMIE